MRWKIKKCCCIFVEKGINFIRKQQRSDQYWENAVKYFKITSDAWDVEEEWIYRRCLTYGWGIEADEIVGFHLIQEIKDASPIAKFFYAFYFPDKHEERLNNLRELMNKRDLNGFSNMR
jgi:hypothetical protein